MRIKRVIIILFAISILFISIDRVFGARHTLEDASRVLMSKELYPIGNDVWTQRGPNYAEGQGPLVRKIVIDQTNPDIVYAATNQGVYRSTDNGETWRPQNNGLGGFGDLQVRDIEIDPNNAETLIIGTWGSGIYRSKNSGESWTRLPKPSPETSQFNRGYVDSLTPLENIVFGSSPDYYDEKNDFISKQPEGYPKTWNFTAVNNVTIHPGDSDKIYVSFAYEGLYLVSITVDNADKEIISWEKKENVGPTNAGSRTYVFSPSTNQIRYASFDGAGELYRSIDFGSSWEKVGDPTITSTVTDIAIQPGNPEIVIATAFDGVYRSNNGGNSWSRVMDADTFYSVAFAPSSSNVVYVGGYSWIYKSTDSGKNWTVADNTIQSFGFYGLAVHPEKSGTVFAGSAVSFTGESTPPAGGVYKKVFDSAFSMKKSGMEDTFVLDIEQDPNNSQKLWAATWGGGAFYSDDNGLTWSNKLSIPKYVLDIEAANNGNSTILYATTFYSNYGTYKSVDGGETWQDLGNSYSGSSISFDIKSINNDPNHLVAATYRGIQYSSDGGYNWTEATNLNAETGIIQSLCEWENTGRMLAATYGGGMFYSPNGEDWYEANVGVTGLSTYSEYTYDVACSPDVPGLAYVAGAGVYRTTDYGEHWESVATDVSANFFRSVYIVPNSGEILAASYQSGVFIAPEGGDNWSEINDGLLELRMRSIRAISSTPLKLLAGTNGRGAWEYTLIDSLTTTDRIFLPLVVSGSTEPSLPLCKEFEPNNSMNGATVILANNSYCSYIDSQSDEDYYRFETKYLRKIIVKLDHIPPGANYNLEIYDSDRNLIHVSYNSENKNEEVVIIPNYIGRYYVKVYALSGYNKNSGYHLHTSSDVRGAGRIYGTVSYNDSPIDTIPVLLAYDNAYRDERIIATPTTTEGAYTFTGMNSLPIGHHYYVLYANNLEDNQYLRSWICPKIDDYKAATAEPSCSFDIRNVFAQSPSSDSVENLPVTFIWNRRGVIGDNYRLRLRSIDNTKSWSSDLLGDTGNYVLYSLPPNFNYGEEYKWDVLVQNGIGNGTGYPYDDRTITFSNALNSLEDREPD